jgi:elongation factor P
MAIKAQDMRKGMGVNYKDQVWVVHSATHVAKGNKRSYMQIELKSIRDGQIIRDRFRVDETLEPAIFERKPMEYLYTEGSNHIMMDLVSFEQVEIPAALIGDDRVYLTPNIHVEIAFVDERVVSVELPNAVELKVVDVPPGVKGATVTNVLKDALCEGGARVKVPSFIENGTRIRVDTRTGEYLGRA